MKASAVSTHTRNNWLIDTGLLVSAVQAASSGIYFPILLTGGDRGGWPPGFTRACGSCP